MKVREIILGENSGRILKALAIREDFEGFKEESEIFMEESEIILEEQTKTMSLRHDSC